MCKTMPPIRTYTYNSGKIAFRKAVKMYACTIAFSSLMVVMNQLVSHSLVLHHSFTGLLVAFDNDCPAGGRDNGEIA